jgi:aldehyde dehydrogenase (NAD+)
MYINGEWRQTDERDTIEVTDPSTGDEIATIPAGTESDVADAYTAASEAQSDWAARSPAERREVVQNVLRLLEEEYQDEVLDLLIAESGSTPAKAQGEFTIATAVTRHATTLPARKTGEHVSSDIPERENLVQREPKGVVGVISPWNYPLHLSLRAVAPAIALGNTVVLKPDEQTPIGGGLAIAQLFEQAGLPDGVLNVVPGEGPEAGDAVASHPDAALISFTGSTEVGKQVASKAAKNLATPAMELGGNNAHIVTNDADVNEAVDAGTFGTFIHQGQVCISINRHLVHEDIYDEYVDKLAERASNLPVGNAHDDDTVVGPIINEEQRDSVLSYIEGSIDQGATLETGGDFDGLIVEPTVLSEVTNEMPTACNENFGPVAPVIPFADDAEAIELANDTEYGLSGSVYAGNLDHAKEIADDIRTGMIHLNDQPMNTEPEYVPFGGMKGSGMGRYNARAILREFTEEKWISFQHEPREYPF